MRYNRIRDIVAILILSFVAACAIVSDEETNAMGMSPACIESFNACKDFMTNRRCVSRSAWKRTTRLDAPGVFWANRGKRDPKFTNSRLFVDEPSWTLVRRDDDSAFDPYFTTRGKKLREDIRNRRTAAKSYPDAVSPFLAARGKKDNTDYTE